MKAARNVIHRIGLLLVLGTGASFPLAGQDNTYEQFRALYDTGGPTELEHFAQRAQQDASVALAILASGAAHYRNSNPIGTLAVLDSLSALEPPAELRIRATGLKFRSMAYAKLGAIPQALSAAEHGALILRNVGPVVEVVDLGVVRAEALIAALRYEDAIEGLSAAQAVAERIGYERGRCLIEFTMASIAFKQARYDRAWDGFRSALGCARAVGADKLALNASSNLASVAVMQKRHNAALQLFDSLLTVGPELSPLVRSHILAQRGHILQRTGDHLGALPYLERSLRLRDSIGDVFGQAKILQHLSSSNWKLGQRNTGLDNLERALAIADSTKQQALSAEIHWKLHEWYSTMGDQSLAVAHLRARSELLDSINSKKFNDAVAASEIQFETAQKERRIAEQDQALKFAAEQDRRRSTQRNAFLVTTILLTLVALLLHRNLRNRARLARKEKELHHEQVDQLLSQQEIKSMNAMLEGQEQERERVSKELHDHVGHLLGSIKHQLGVLETQVADVKTEQVSQYKKLSGLLDNAAGELRRISHDMAAATLNRFGLEKALKELRDTLHINGRLQVELNTFGLERPLERSVEIAVYRIIQEAVSNVLKHAQASEITIGVTHAPGRLSVVVSDNGIGFDTSATDGGVGLANIRARAAALGAQAQIDSAPGKGTSVSVEWAVVG